MTRWTVLTVMFGLSGCIIYDTDEPKCDGCYADSGSWGGGGGGGGNGDTADSAPIVEEAQFVLTPSEAEIGATVIASLTVLSGEFDLSQVSTARFYGGVQILAAENRGSELLMTIAVDPQAVAGPVDLLLEINDGTVQLIDDALLIVEAEQNTGGGGGDDTGSGCE